MERLKSELDVEKVEQACMTDDQQPVLPPATVPSSTMLEPVAVTATAGKSFTEQQQEITEQQQQQQWAFTQIEVVVFKIYFEVV